jgi:hypothetical protein
MARALEANVQARPERPARAGIEPLGPIRLVRTP